ncbi:lysylphosphatidylglycerol synthase domain-containing protein [Demequina pelophila]|uniref:lysylphosphatidylglycerol synthase domain-containing protein n=1 Tax=Demequina pelophila TaxID=1638984 RepID=UPI000783742B|nr:lysylphosphatidylglycerol synthase domain-containing protein [Demequina pelophila]
MRNALRWGFLAVAAGLLVWAVVETWDDVSAGLASLTLGSVLGAFAAGLTGLFCSALAWRAVMRAIGLDTHILEALRVFFLSQMGKYVPGAVWPVLAQAEFARDHGVSRARAFTGSIVAMIVGAATAGVVGALALLVSVPGSLADYWWALILVAGMAATLVPPVLERLVTLAFRLTKRTETPAHVGAGPLAVAVLWNAAQWLFQGLQAWLLLRELAHGASLALAIGAFAFSWLVGFVVVFAPAGAGAREGALVLTLRTVATTGEALSIAIVSRFLLTLADLAGLGVGLLIGARGRRASESGSTGQ